MKVYKKEEWLEYIESNDLLKDYFQIAMDQLLKPHPEQFKKKDNVILRKHFLMLDKGKDDPDPLFLEITIAYVLHDLELIVLPGELWAVTIYDDKPQFDLYRSMASAHTNTQTTPQSN